jgi:hypothetical protein
MKLSDLEYSLLLAIDVEAEDRRDYVPLGRAIFHFASLNVALNTVDSCVAKQLVITRELNKVDCISLTESGIRHCIARKVALECFPELKK